MTTRPISPMDLTFLVNDNRDCPQHIAGVLLLDNPRPGTWTIADLVQHYRAATPVKPFDAVPSFRRLGPPAWVVQTTFDMRYHVQHVALPAPGTDEQLDELIQQWHSEPLDMHRPLFQMTIVEGVQGGRFAIYVKMHHSIVDGMSAVYRLLASLDKNPDAPMRLPLFAVDTGRRARPAAAGSAMDQLKKSLAGLKRQAASAQELTGELVHRARAVAAGARVEGSAPFGSAASLINAPLRYGHSFAHLSLPMAPLRAAAKAHEGGTLNDAFLAIVDTALTRYLAERKHPTTEPLHALVPVSQHEGEASADGGNAITAVICAMGAPDAEAPERLEQIVANMRATKARMRRLSKEAATNYYLGLFMLAQGLGAVGVRRPVANYVVSNVPATADDTYLGGSRLLGAFPVNLLAVSMGLSVTLVSRAGQFDIGFIANRNVMPDVQRLAALAAEAFQALTQAQPKTSRAGAGTGAKTVRKAPSAKKRSAPVAARQAAAPEDGAGRSAARKRPRAASPARQSAGTKRTRAAAVVEREASASDTGKHQVAGE